MFIFIRGWYKWDGDYCLKEKKKVELQSFVDIGCLSEVAMMI